MTKEMEKRAFNYCNGIEYLHGDTISVQEHCRKYGYISGAREQISIDAKWIRENVGADVAVDFLNAMKD